MAGKVDENKQQEGLEREYAPIISAQEATTNKMNDLIKLISSGAPEYQIRRADRKSVVQGKSVDQGGRSIIKKKKKKKLKTKKKKN